MTTLSTRKRLAVLTILVATLAACEGPQVRGKPPRSTGTPSSSTQPSASPAVHAEALLYLDRQGLWLYSFAGHGPRRVAGTDVSAGAFALKSATESTYFSPKKLSTFDAEDGSTHELLTVGGGTAMDWSPDGRTLAYLTTNNQNGSSVTASLLPQGGKSRRLWESRKWAGRGGTQLDEISIAWSPDGTLVLIVVTPLDTTVAGDKIVTSDTIFVLRTDGSDAVHSWFGTMARWSRDGASIFYRGLGADTTWHARTLSNGAVSALALPSTAYRPSVSPDGARISFDDGARHPSLYVFDRATGTTHLIATDHVAPVWLSNDSLAAAPTSPCMNCEGAQWAPAGRSSIFDVEDHSAPKKRASSIGSIAWGADVSYG